MSTGRGVAVDCVGDRNVGRTVASTLRTAVAVGPGCLTIKSDKLPQALAVRSKVISAARSIVLLLILIFPKFIPNLIWDKFGINGAAC